MMKIVFSIIILFVFWGGCASTIPSEPSGSSEPLPEPVEPVGWVRYEDPAHRFTFMYPDDWIQTQGRQEVQFWDNLDDGVNSVKVSLFQEFRPFEDIQQYTVEDQGTQTKEHFESTTVNDLPVVIRTAHNAWGETITYYYDMDSIVIGLIAMFQDDNKEVREQVHTLQQSLHSVGKEKP